MPVRLQFIELQTNQILDEFQGLVEEIELMKDQLNVATEVRTKIETQCENLEDKLD